MENVRKYVPDEETQKIDIYIYWKIFWRKKLYLIVPVILSVLISMAGIRYLTPVYQSSTIVSVEEQNILAQTMGRYITSAEETQRLRSRQFRSMIDTRLRSRSFLEQVILDLELNRKATNIRQEIEKNHKDSSEFSVEERVMRKLVALLRDKIQVTSETPGFYSISVLDSNPEIAYRLASKVADKYIEVTKQAELQGLRQAGAFSDEQLAIYREKLETSEKELSMIKKDLAATETETNPVNASNLQIAEARKTTISAEIERNSITLNRIRERLNAIFGLVPSSENVTRDETVINIERQLMALSDERLLALIGGDATISEDDAIMNSLWSELRDRISLIVNGEYGEFSAELRPLITEYFYQRYVVDHYRTRERKLQGYIDRHNQNIARRPQLQREENRLNHEVETNRAIYQAFLESKTSAQITEAVQSTNLGVRIGIIEKAEKPLVPVKPKPLKIIILALGFGFICGFGAILITEYADDSFKSVEEVQRIMKSPVLGTIPKTVSHFAWEKKKRGRLLLGWIIGIFIFMSVVSGALFMYARILKSSGIGVEEISENNER